MKNKNFLSKFVYCFKKSVNAKHGVLKKGISAIAIASTLTLSIFGITACDFFSVLPGNNPGEDPGGPNTNPDSQYSTLVQNILNDSNINDLLARARETNSLYTTAYFDSHPYTFLSQQGHNVSAIKKGELQCRTITYVKDSEPNNLYMMTYVENEASTPYFTEYALRYTLTDKEMDDYHFLHYHNGQYYVQAVFINDEISEQKNATILSKTKILVDAHKNFQTALQKDLNTTNPMGTNKLDIMLNDHSVADNTFSLYVFSRIESDKTMAIDGKIGIIPLEGSDSRVKAEGDIFTSPKSGSMGQSFTIYSRNQFTESLEDITLYDSQTAGLNNEYMKRLD